MLILLHALSCFGELFVQVFQLLLCMFHFLSQSVDLSLVLLEGIAGLSGFCSLSFLYDLVSVESLLNEFNIRVRLTTLLLWVGIDWLMNLLASSLCDLVNLVLSVFV